MSYASEELFEGVLTEFAEAQHKGRRRWRLRDDWRVQVAFDAEHRAIQRTRRFGWRLSSPRLLPAIPPRKRLYPRLTDAMPRHLPPAPCPTCGGAREWREGAVYPVHLGRCGRAA